MIAQISTAGDVGEIKTGSHVAEVKCGSHSWATRHLQKVIDLLLIKLLSFLINV